VQAAKLKSRESIAFLRARTHKIAIGDSDLINVRFGPICGLKPDIPRGPRSARTGLMQCSKGLLFRQAPPSADQLSLEQSRGVIRFSAAYFAAISLTIGSVTLSSAVYQSEMTFHALPSHC